MSEETSEQKIRRQLAEREESRKKTSNVSEENKDYWTWGNFPQIWWDSVKAAVNLPAAISKPIVDIASKWTEEQKEAAEKAKQDPTYIKLKNMREEIFSEIDKIEREPFEAGESAMGPMGLLAGKLSRAILVGDEEFLRLMDEDYKDFPEDLRNKIFDYYSTVTATPEEIKQLEYEEIKAIEQETGKPYIPATVDEVVLSPDLLSQLETQTGRKLTDSDILKLKQNIYTQWALNPFVYKELDNVWIYALDESNYENVNTKEEVQTFTLEEMYAERLEIKKVMEGTEDWEFIFADASIVEDKQNPGLFQLVVSKGDKKIILNEGSREIVEEALARRQEQQLASRNVSEEFDAQEWFENYSGIASQFMQEQEQMRATYERELLKFLSDNNMTWIEEDWFDDLLDRLTKGEANIDLVRKELIENQLLIKYPALKETFDRGGSVRDAAAIYIGTMANLLELPMDAVSLDDMTIQKALQYQTDKGESRLKPLSEFERDIKLNDPRYRYTDQARSKAVTMSAAIARQFGRL
jgi:hypothetical protein